MDRTKIRSSYSYASVYFVLWRWILTEFEVQYQTKSVWKHSDHASEVHKFRLSLFNLHAVVWIILNQKVSSPLALVCGHQEWVPSTEVQQGSLVHLWNPLVYCMCRVKTWRDLLCVLHDSLTFVSTINQDLKNNTLPKWFLSLFCLSLAPSFSFSVSLTLSVPLSISPQTPSSWAEDSRGRRGGGGHKRSASWGSAEHLREVSFSPQGPPPGPVLNLRLKAFTQQYYFWQLKHLHYIWLFYSVMKYASKHSSSLVTCLCLLKCFLTGGLWINPIWWALAVCCDYSGSVFRIMNNDRIKNFISWILQQHFNSVLTQSYK